MCLPCEILVAKQVHLVIIYALVISKKMLIIVILLVLVVVLITHPYWTMLILATVLSILL